MATPYEMFKTDPKIEVEQGVVLDYGEFKIRIARAGGSNKRFERLLRARMKPHRRQFETDTLPEEVATKLMTGVYADAVVLGWEGVKDEDGKTLAFNRENVIKLFTDLPDLFRDVQAQAGLVSLFKVIELEEDEKKYPAA